MQATESKCQTKLAAEMALAHAAKEGDSTAFEQLVRLHQGVLTEETAEILGLRISAVKALFLQARLQLRDGLSQYFQCDGRPTGAAEEIIQEQNGLEKVAEKHFLRRVPELDREGVMALEIVWRNPLPPAGTESRVERVTLDDLGAVYAVYGSDTAQQFELLLGGAA